MPTRPNALRNERSKSDVSNSTRWRTRLDGATPGLHRAHAAHSSARLFRERARSTPSKRCAGSDPYGPGAPRSVSTRRSVAWTSVPRVAAISSANPRLLFLGVIVRHGLAIGRLPGESVVREVIAAQLPLPAGELAGRRRRDSPRLRGCRLRRGAVADGRPPRRVMICTTPPIASEPYNALCGPRTTSIRSTSPSGTWERSRPPPNALARMPSTRTSVKSDSPPRGKTEVSVPGPPFRATANPGTERERLGDKRQLSRGDLRAVDHRDRIGHARERLIDL